jgi:hypothetical protein
MSNNKRKRAVVLALIAFFCGATAFVSVDWKRFGGGFLAFFKHNSEPVPVYAGGSLPSGGGTLGGGGDSHAGTAALPQLVALGARRHANSVGGGGGHKSDEDLFKYGDPAAGGIPPGSFLVAQNDTAGSGNGGAGAPAPVGGLAATETGGNPGSGDSGSSGVSSPAPAPGGTGGAGDGGILFPTPSPSPSPTPGPSPAPTPPTPPVSPPPPVVSPPVPTPPAPTPTQSGTSDQNPGNGGGDLPPVSAVPEASGAAMMGLGALFLAVAATRRRKNDQA